jgi:hypothetical protein
VAPFDIAEYSIKEEVMTAILKKPPIYKILYFQVLVAVVLSVLLAYVYPSLGTEMKPASAERRPRFPE